MNVKNSKFPRRFEPIYKLPRQGGRFNPLRFSDRLMENMDTIS